ncbi:carbohydrate ABC transporter permease [Micromonospora sp. LZ34]
MSDLPLAAEREVADRRTGGGRRSIARPDRLSLLLVFVGVPFAGYALLVLWPFGQAAAYSLTSWGGFSPDKPFVGLDNFVELAGDDLFRKAVVNTLVLLTVLPVLTLLISYVLALLITIGGPSQGQVRGLRGSGFYRVVAFFPYVVPAIIIGIIWAQVYDPSDGLLNGILRQLGLDRLGSYAWLGQQQTAMWATIAVVAWAFAGFYMVLFIAAIRGIPTELFEAARLDGAGRLRTALSIVAPSIAGTIRTSYIYMGIVALDMFVFMAVFNPSGGPRNSTLVVTQEIYITAFTNGKFGLACAMGVVLAVMTFAFIGLVAMVRRLAGAR